jgi:hypothetical protein
MDNLDFFYNQVDVIVGNNKQLVTLDSNLSLHAQLPANPKKYVLYLKENIEVLSLQYFLQIQWLISQNNYLDVLKHPTWLLFNTDNVLLHPDRNYWSLNLRPTYGFDDSTWRSVS